MARGINKVLLVGHVGQDPQVSQKTVKVCRFSLATSEAYKDKSSGEKIQTTEWHRLVCFDKLADIVEQYVKKGSLVYVEGKLKTTKYTDKEGVERFSVDIVVGNLMMLDKKADGNIEPGDTSENEYKNKGAYGNKKETNAFQNINNGFQDDSIPF